jgi:hypothetical protein
LGAAVLNGALRRPYLSLRARDRTSASGPEKLADVYRRGADRSLDPIAVSCHADNLAGFE